MTDRDKVVRELAYQYTSPMRIMTGGALEKALAAAYDAGRAAERADVVAWLRDYLHIHSQAGALALSDAARCFERGAHQREGQKP